MSLRSVLVRQGVTSAGLTVRFARGVASMAMQVESLEVLEKAEVAPAQARAIVRAIELEIAGAKDVLATKHDLLALRSDLRGEMAELAASLRGEMAVLAASLRGDMTELAASLRGEMAAMRGELKAEIHEAVGGVTRQMYLAILGQMAVLLGFAYFFATHIR